MDILLPAIERFPIEPAHVMMFARAIGDPNPIYRDRDYAAATEFGGIIAPPTFLDCGWTFFPEFQFRPRPDRPWWGSGRRPSGAEAPDAFRGGSSLFVSNGFEYFAPLRAGIELSVHPTKGRSWQKTGSRSGLLTFHEVDLDYRDRGSGAPVARRSMTYVFTQRPPDLSRDRPAARDEAWRMPDFPRHPVRPPRAGEIEVGATFEERLVSDLSRAQIAMYAGASGDFAPHHVDEVFSTQVEGFPSVFAPGMLTMAMLARLLTDWLGDGRLRRYRVDFLRQVWPGDDLTGRLQVVAVDRGAGPAEVELALQATNQHGEVVARGQATGLAAP